MLEVSNKPTLSFLVCTRNRLETVRECVLNLLNSARLDIEIIVRDNASEDDTVKVLNSIKDERIKIYESSENQGTRNFFEISKLATGKIVTWISDEDNFEFSHFDYIISQFENPLCNVLLGSILVGKGHQVGFSEGIISNAVNANLTALKFSGCGGVFVRSSTLKFANAIKISNDEDAYILWNYYPVGFFATRCIQSTLFTTTKVLVKQARFATTNNNWSIQKTGYKKRLPHYYPESIFDRLSSNITNIIFKDISTKDKFIIICKLLKGFYSQSTSYKHPGLILILNENYDPEIVKRYLNHINNYKFENFLFRSWYLIKQSVKLIGSIYFTFNYWYKLNKK